MKRNSIVMAGLAATMALSVSAALAADKGAKESQKFIKSAIEGNYAEVDLGKLAQEKGKSQAVKDYGTMLVTDHGAANDKAKAAASQLDVKPPSGASMTEKAEYLKLKVLSGDTFDRTFAKGMVKDHQDDIKNYEKEARQSDASGAYAKETLPTLQKHLDAAQKLQSQVAAPTTGSAPAK